MDTSGHTADPTAAETGPGSEDGSVAAGGLQQGLRQRHMSLIAIGGVIGAGLFVGSGVVIHGTGPAAIISFFTAGVLTVLIMRMLAEMTAARPALGSFYAYARESLGDRTGFTVGWLYWYFYVIVVAVEAVAGGRLLQLWLPQVPMWLLSLGLMALLSATNLVSARSYGEFEYWFSGIKVAAICVFLLLGALYAFGLWPHAQPEVGQNLAGHGGFMPHGFGAVLTAVVPCVGFFTGAEIVTIAAAESREPRKAVARATNSIILRVLLFYVGSVFLVVALRPWDGSDIMVSPYAAVLNRLGVPAVQQLMNAVVLTAVLSCLNSSLYTSSRMLFALTRNGDAPRGFTRLNRRGVPVRAILLGAAGGYVSVVMAYISPNGVFDFLINSYGAVALFVYVIIALAHLRQRRRLEREEPERLVLRMWLFPYLSWVAVAGMLAVIVAMAFIPSTRSQFWLSLVTLAVVLAASQLRAIRGRRQVPGARARQRHELPQRRDQYVRPVLGDQRVAVRGPHQPGVLAQLGQPGAVLARHDPVLLGPDHQDLSGEAGQRRRPAQQLFPVRHRLQILHQVAPDPGRLRPAQPRAEPDVRDLARHRPLGQPAEAAGRPPRRRHRAEQPQRRRQAEPARDPAERDHGAAGKSRRVVVEGLTGDQAEPGHPVHLPLGGHHLGAAPVVEDQGDVAQVEPLQELADQPGESGHREVGVGVHRPPVRAERQRGQHAAVVAAEFGDDLPPGRAVHEESVQQDQNRPASSGVLIFDGTGREFDLRHQRFPLPRVAVVWTGHWGENLTQPQEAGNNGLLTLRQVIDGGRAVEVWTQRGGVG
jgi:AAT family amino acid transporter/GABA permease